MENMGCDGGKIGGSAAECVSVCVLGVIMENEDAEFFGLSVIALWLAPRDFCKAFIFLKFLLPVSRCLFSRAVWYCSALPYIMGESILAGYTETHVYVCIYVNVCTNTHANMHTYRRVYVYI